MSLSFLLTKRLRGLSAIRSLSMASPQLQEPGPIETSIRNKLKAQLLSPVQVHITNESVKHAHHRAMLESGGGPETHFSVEVISDGFQGKTTMQRHRMVYSILSDEMAQGLHSLTLKTKSCSELTSSP